MIRTRFVRDEGARGIREQSEEVRGSQRRRRDKLRAAKPKRRHTRLGRINARSALRRTCAAFADDVAMMSR